MIHGKFDWPVCGSYRVLYFIFLSWIDSSRASNTFCLTSKVSKEFDRNVKNLKKQNGVKDSEYELKRNWRNHKR